MHELAHEVSNRVTTHEMHECINRQLLPVVTAMSSLEKTIQLQEATQSNVHASQSQKQAFSSIMAEDPVSVAVVHEIVGNVIRENRLGEVTPVRVDAALSQHTEHLLREMNSITEASRMELGVAQQEHINAINVSIMEQTKELTIGMKENR